MGLLQTAIETYDSMAPAYAGISIENKEPLAPIGHMIASAKIKVTIDTKGGFINADAINEKIVIPCTEDSASRSGANASDMVHPLCEKIDYIIDGGTKKIRTAFLEALDAWKDSAYTHPKIEAIAAYLKKGTLYDDLVDSGLIKMGSLTADIICWVVVGLGTDSGPVWTDCLLQERYIGYITEKLNQEGKHGTCMISGQDAVLTRKHTKGVVAFYGNAKIISANDTSNFTYRGRFKTDMDAATIGYESSQKAHNALKWLVATQAVMQGGRAFLCWNPHGKKVRLPQNPLLRSEQLLTKPSEYKDALNKVLAGCKADLPEGEDVIIAIFASATPGRLSVTYFNELQGSDFMERLAYWDETCCWYNGKFGIQSPQLSKIVTYAFGIQRGETFEVDEKVLSQQMQRLITCRVSKGIFPADVMYALAKKTSNLQVLTEPNRRNLLFIACAVIRKYRYDRMKEEWEMSLEPQKKDRSYQYGRLLAVLEKIENDVLNAANDQRETNAMRLQAVYLQRPAYAAHTIMSQLKTAYYPRLSAKSRIYYERLIGEIYDMLSEFPDAELNKPLGETYLFGYYLQRNALYTKREQTDNELLQDNN